MSGGVNEGFVAYAWGHVGLAWAAAVRRSISGLQCLRRINPAWGWSQQGCRGAKERYVRVCPRPRGAGSRSGCNDICDGLDMRVGLFFEVENE